MRIQGQNAYEFDREYRLLFKNLGLLQRFPDDFQRAEEVLAQGLRIYKEMELIAPYEFLRAKRGTGKKVRLRVYVQKFPHVNLPANRFL